MMCVRTLHLMACMCLQVLVDYTPVVKLRRGG